jgi:hypothetical protein
MLNGRRVTELFIVVWFLRGMLGAGVGLVLQSPRHILPASPLPWTVCEGRVCGQPKDWAGDAERN